MVVYSLDDMDLFAVVECNKNNEPSQILVFMHQFQNLTNKLFFKNIIVFNLGC